MKLGIDPEFFILDRNNKPINAFTLCKGTKYNPYKSNDIEVFYDNVLLEFNTLPASNLNEFLNTISTAIFEVVKVVDGNSISLSDVQNICSPGRSYWLDKEDFETDFPMTYQEYKDKRTSNVRIMMANQANSNIKDKVGDEKYLEICKTNSISKRTCDSQTMVDIFLDKYTSLTAAKSSLKHTNKSGEQVTVSMVTQIWNGGTTLFESDFEGRNDISYSKYLTDVKEDKTTFTKDLENKEKYEQVLSDVENKKLKELTRTNIKYLKMFGKDDKFIIDLRAKIKAQ